MKRKINDFLDLFPEFHGWEMTDQILTFVYFHTVEEGRGSVSKDELLSLFRMSDVAVPQNLPQLLAYLCGKGKKLNSDEGEFSLRREVRQRIEAEIRKRRDLPPPPPPPGQSPYDFPGRVFTDKKIVALLGELRRCYAQQCWNACGLLMRIIIERTLDTVDETVKSKIGLKDKINRSREIKSLSKSLREGLEHLHGMKLAGDIAAHHSTVILDVSDINLALPPFRALLKEVTTV